jgi:hypothetical protein
MSKRLEHRHCQPSSGSPKVDQLLGPNSGGCPRARLGMQSSTRSAVRLNRACHHDPGKKRRRVRSISAVSPGQTGSAPHGDVRSRHHRPRFVRRRPHPPKGCGRRRAQRSGFCVHRWPGCRWALPAASYRHRWPRCSAAWVHVSETTHHGRRCKAPTSATLDFGHAGSPRPHPHDLAIVWVLSRSVAADQRPRDEGLTTPPGRQAREVDRGPWAARLRACLENARQGTFPSATRSGAARVHLPRK